LPKTVITDPNTNAPFPNNIIPQNRLDPLSVKLATQYLPLPNSGTQYISVQNKNIDDLQYLVKIDQVVSSNNHLSGRYFYDEFDFQRPFNAPTGFFAANYFRNQTATLEDTQIFSPTLTATFFVSFGRFARTQIPQAPVSSRSRRSGNRFPWRRESTSFPVSAPTSPASSTFFRRRSEAGPDLVRLQGFGGQNLGPA
jgi:hypothetical protein